MLPLFVIAAIVVALLFLIWVWGRRAGAPVDRALLDYVLHTETDSPGIQPRPLDITVVVTNLNDFMRIFGELGDQAGAALLNEYYSLMTPIVRRHRGYLNPFEFDALFFFFGPIFAPSNENHAAKAIRAVLDMQAAMDQWNDVLTKRGLPRLRMRAGIATGEAAVGDIGGPQFTQFTAIGPAVNLARRLEKACKETDAQNLVSAQTCARTSAFFRFRSVDPTPLGHPDGGLDSFEALAITP